MHRETLERKIAMTTEVGRSSLAARDNAIRSMTGEQKVAKAFELTETTRQFMRAGMRAANPDISEAELQELYVERLLHFHGTSFAEVRRKQEELRKTRWT
jgi:hypothetical protein